MTGFDQILKYTTAYGLVSETECPLDTNNAFTPEPGDPWPLATGWQNRVWKTANYQWVSLANLKNAIKTTGPVEMGFNASRHVRIRGRSESELSTAGNNGDDHTVSLVGFCDDPTCPNGGYWIVKNSWGTAFGDNGYGYIPYGSSLDINQHTYSLGPVYYTGPMYHTGPWDGTGADYTGTAATNTWKGTTNGTWDTTSGTSANWSNNSTGQAFTWVNQELQAVFDNTGSNRAITVSGTVIAHGLTFNSGATGYSFSGGSLTVTAGGITANESVSFSSNVYIGGPQSWNVASGKTLTVSGPLHTIVSDLTFSGAGTTTISGTIDGGGVLNSQGAKPGGLIQAGTGPVYLTGATNFSGNITANRGGNALHRAARRGFRHVWDGGLLRRRHHQFQLLGPHAGRRGLELHRHPYLAKGSARSPSCRPPALPARSAAPLNNNGSVTQNGAGTTILNGTNTYTGGYDDQQRRLAGEHRHGIPSGSFLSLDGGVLQSNGSSARTSPALWHSGGTFQWTANGGGFSAGPRR